METEAEEARAVRVIKDFKEAYRKFIDYINYVETLLEEKRTMKQKELIAKFGSKRKKHEYSVQ